MISLSKENIMNFLQKLRQNKITKNREKILNPNKGSRLKLMEYELPLSQVIELGTPMFYMPNLISMHPDTIIRPNRLVCNVPCSNFIYLADIKGANISVSISNAVTDAYNYKPDNNNKLDFPLLTPANSISILAFYPGFIPEGMGYKKGEQFIFTATFFGPAEMVSI